MSVANQHSDRSDKSFLNDLGVRLAPCSTMLSIGVVSPRDIVSVVDRALNDGISPQFLADSTPYYVFYNAM